MRIDALHLKAFGPFTDTRLDLSMGEEGLHLVYGDNEAGKTTALRALSAWLFGIPLRTRDDFVHHKPALRIGGALRLKDGEALSFDRLKRNKAPLRDPETDEPIAASRLDRFLSNMEQALFEQLYGIDHERLVRGGQEILKQSGDVGQALFGAAAGMTGLRDLATELASKAAELFKPKGSKDKVNEAARLFKEAKKKVAAASRPVADWQRLKQALEATQQEARDVEDEIIRLTGEKSRLERVRRVRAPLAERRALLDRIAEQGEVLILPDDFADKLGEARRALLRSEASLDKLEDRRSHLEVEAAQLTPRQELLDNEAVVTRLYKQLGAIEKEMTDLPKREGEHRQLQSEASTRLRAVRPDLGLDNAEQLRCFVTRQKWIADLAKQHGLLEQEARQALEALGSLEEERRGLERDLAAVGTQPVDVGELKVLVAAAQREGDLEARLAEAAAREREARRSCETELARLGRCSGSIDDLARRALPLTETLDRFEKRFDALDDRDKAHRPRAEKLERELSLANGELRSLLASGDVPSLADLTAARAERDAGWQLVRRKFIDGEDPVVDVAAYAGESDLPAAYEARIAAADGVADRLRAAADRVSERTHLEGRIARLRDELDDIGQARAADGEERRLSDAEWCAVWDGTGIAPGSPREMKQWLFRAEKLLAERDLAAAATDSRQRLEETLGIQVEALNRVLGALDESVGVATATRSVLLSIASRRIETAEASAETRRQLERDIEKCRASVLRVEEKRAAVNARQAKWREEWQQAVDGLGLPDEAHPMQVTEILSELGVFFSKLDGAETLARRISAIEMDIREFEERVARFADENRISREGLTAAELVAKLHLELSEAREKRASLEKIARQIKELTEEIGDAEVAQRGALKALDALATAARVEDDGELEQRAELSKQRRGWEARLEELGRELLRNGDGRTVEALAEEVEASAPDSSAADLERVAGELEAFRGRQQLLNEQKGSVTTQMSAIDGSAAAAEAAEEAEQHLADIVSGAESYLRLEAASLILRQQIERYRRAHQTPVLARAGELFARLTLGSFTGLKDELDDDGRPLLLGVRGDSREVAVDGMSDGTRDQLYLALRLATLEQRFGPAEPMPFIVDDILVGFDDARTRAGLEVLAELAEKTQVLLFTHHRRVVELAETLTPPAGVFVHELGR